MLKVYSFIPPNLLPTYKTISIIGALYLMNTLLWSCSSAINDSEISLLTALHVEIAVKGFISYLFICLHCKCLVWSLWIGSEKQCLGILCCILLDQLPQPLWHWGPASWKKMRECVFHADLLGAGVGASIITTSWLIWCQDDWRA